MDVSLVVAPVLPLVVPPMLPVSLSTSVNVPILTKPFLRPSPILSTMA